jgi:hypothetical protein
LVDLADHNAEALAPLGARLTLRKLIEEGDAGSLIG